MPPPVLMRSFSATTPLASQGQAVTSSYPGSTAVGVPINSTSMSTYYQHPLQIATGVPQSGAVASQPFQLYAPYGSQGNVSQPACVSSSWTPSVTCNADPVTGSPAVQSGQALQGHAPLGIPVMQGRPLTHVHSAPVMSGSPAPYQSWGTPATAVQTAQVMGAPAAHTQMLHQASEVEGLPVTTTAPPPVPAHPSVVDPCMQVPQPHVTGGAPVSQANPPAATNGYEMQSAFMPLTLEGNGECGSSTDACHVELTLEEKPVLEGIDTLENGERSSLSLAEQDDGAVWSHGWTQDWCGDEQQNPPL